LDTEGRIPIEQKLSVAQHPVKQIRRSMIHYHHLHPSPQQRFQLALEPKRAS
jgi:hypothetical protein